MMYKIGDYVLVHYKDNKFIDKITRASVDGDYFLEKENEWYNQAYIVEKVDSRNMVFDTQEESEILAIAKEIAKLVDMKDKNYNHAFDKSCDMFRDYDISKLYEKYQRIYNFKTNDIACEEEGLEDSLMDLIGYALLMIRRLRRDK